jgi:nucleoside phosphorylase
MRLSILSDWGRELTSVPSDPAAGQQGRAWWDVTIGVIAALPVEAAAMETLIRDPLPAHFSDDPNEYKVGYLDSVEPGRPHRVALTTMPNDNTRMAATTCTDMLRTFPGIRCVVLTGIAGGVPNPDDPAHHVRLGDVVVAVDGIVDYGHVRRAEGGSQLRRPTLGLSIDLVRAVRQLQGRLVQGESPHWNAWLAPADGRKPMAAFARPEPTTDQLHLHDVPIEHPPPAATGHLPRQPKIHFGRIGSADELVVDEAVRDELAARFGVLAFEMEAAGIADSAAGRGVGWFMVRGIVDYCDRYKTDDWHPYASLTAAGCVRAVLQECRPFPVWRMTSGGGVIALLPDHELDRLVGLLKLAPELDTQEVWRTAMDGLTPLPAAAPETLAELAVHLIDLNAGASRLPPVLAFVEEVATRVEHRLAQQLRSWTDEVATRLQITEVVRAHRAGAAERRQAAADRHPPIWPCLLIQIERDGIDRERCEVRYWVQRRSDDWHPEPGDTQHTSFREVEQALQAAIQRAEEIWRDNNGPVEVELLLPTELLHKAVEWWHIELSEPAPIPLCLDYPVVVRSLDRMRASYRHRVWANRWRSLWRHPAQHRLYWGRTSAGDADLHRWNSRLRNDPDVTTVVLGHPPEQAPGREELRSALNAGIPVILWDRRPELAPDTAQLLQRMAQGDPTELPHQIRALRSAAAILPPDEQQRHPGRHLALLWDDPDRTIDDRRA